MSTKTVKLVLGILILSFICAILIKNSIFAASVTTVSVDSSTVGVQVVSSTNAGVVVTLPSNAAVAVWFAREEETCSTSLTAVRGVRVTPGNGYEFLSKEDQWTGQICAILESGSTAVTVSVNTW
jgi:hypothetical protein